MNRYAWNIFRNFGKGGNICDFLPAFLHTKPLLKNGPTLKGKNLLPRGIQKNSLDRVLSLESLFVQLKI